MIRTTRHGRRWLLAFAALIAPPSAMAADPAHGGALVGELCSRCHATGETGTSSVPGAVPFRDLKARYPIDDLAESLAEGITTGHPQMPEYAFQPNDIDDILAYLKSL